MKVRVFTGEPLNVEKEIQRFLENGMKPLFVSQSQSDNGGVVALSVTVFYQ